MLIFKSSEKDKTKHEPVCLLSVWSFFMNIFEIFILVVHLITQSTFNKLLKVEFPMSPGESNAKKTYFFLSMFGTSLFSAFSTITCQHREQDTSKKLTKVETTITVSKTKPMQDHGLHKIQYLQHALKGT